MAALDASFSVCFRAASGHTGGGGHKYTSRPGQQNFLHPGTSCVDWELAWFNGTSTEKGHLPDKIGMYFHEMKKHHQKIQNSNNNVPSF